MSSHGLGQFVPAVTGAILAVAACTSSNGAGGADASTGGAPSCPTAASSCPPGCETIKAQPIDFAKGCLAQYQTIGCWVGTGGNDTGLGCVESSDAGTAFRTPSTSYVGQLIASEDWGPCPDGWMSIYGDCP